MRDSHSHNTLKKNYSNDDNDGYNDNSNYKDGGREILGVALPPIITRGRVCLL